MIVRTIIDSDEGYNNEENTTWQLLPHDEYGWNRFDCELINDIITYKGKEVVSLKHIEKFNGGIREFDPEDSDYYKELKPHKYIWYYMFVEKGNKWKSTDDTPVLNNTTFFFDGVPITDAHIHFEIML